MYNTLSIDLTKQASSEEFWIVLEQIKPDDEATIEEAAETLDELFDTSPCDPEPEEDLEDTQGTIESRKEQNQKDLERVREKLKDMREVLYNKLHGLSNEICDNLGLYTVDVKVTRSHQSYPYKLLVDGGEVVSTVINNTEQISETIIVGQQDGITLNLQDGYGTDLTWRGPTIDADGIMDKTPDLDVVKNRVGFGGSVTGVLQSNRTVVYDIVTIDVTDPDGCSVTALYHLSTDQIDLEPPPEDDAAKELCKDLDIIYNYPEDQGPCYNEIIHEVRCNCSNKPSGDSFTTYSEADCGNYVADTIVSSATVVTYKVCDEKDKVSEREYYESVCCQPPTRALPRCKTVYSNWNGRGATPEQLQKLYDTYGVDVTLSGVGPKEGVCGKVIATQVINQKSCCVDVDPLVVTNKSSDTISPGQSVRIDIEGDRGDITWTVNGGYHLLYDVTQTPGWNVVSMDSSGACYGATVRIEGMCFSIADVSPVTGIPPLEIITGEPVVVSPETQVIISANGGVLIHTGEIYHYNWESSGLELVSVAGGNALFNVPEDFCGMGSVTVTDECGTTATVKIKSTEGVWAVVSEFDQCNPPGTYILPEGTGSDYLVVSEDGEYKAFLAYDVSGFLEECYTDWLCLIGNEISENSKAQGICDAGAILPNYPTSYDGNGCCTRTAPDETETYRSISQIAHTLERWECAM